MTLTISPWDRSLEETIQILEIMYLGYPLSPRFSPEDQLIMLKKGIEGFEDSFYCARTSQGIVGYIAVGQNQARQPVLSCSVLPEMRRQGIGEALFARVIKDIRRGQHKVLNSLVFASSHGGIAFMKKHDFQEIDRVSWTSRPLSTPWPEWALAKVHDIQKSEIRVINGVELEHLRNDWAEAWWKLQTGILRDVPSVVPFSETPFEKWKAYIDPPFTYRDHVLFAVLGRELIGSLRLGDLKNDKMNINHTGTSRDYRRRGVSLLLKYKAFELARNKGARFITTQNHRSNPMLALNIKLGFSVQDEAIDYAKKLDDL